MILVSHVAHAKLECPVDCISEGDIYVIDEDVCIVVLAKEVCPVDAISER